jgi:hypothetical protein
VEQLGSVADEGGERELYVESVNSFNSWLVLWSDEAWRAVVEDGTTGFALFLACDAACLTPEALATFAEYCVDHDVFWVSTFGADCERVHDVFDEVDIKRGIGDRGVVMTTWHNDESLTDALDLFWHAFPDELTRGGPARVVLVVGHDGWLDEVRRSAADDLAD